MLQKKIFKYLIEHEDSKLLHALLHRFSNNNFIPEEEDERDYIFGAAQAEDINPTGDYRKMLPDFEGQRHKLFDDMSCVTRSYTQAEEVTQICLKGEYVDNSDRWPAYWGGTTQRGAADRNVLEAIRKKGFVKETSWPTKEDMTWGEYIKTPPKELDKEGEEWSNKNDFRYEAVFQYNDDLLDSMLKKGPVSIAVYGWILGRDGKYYRPAGYGSNHKCLLVCNDRQAKIKWVLDNYPPFVKMLSWDYPLEYVKLPIFRPKNLNEIKARAERKKIIDRGFKYVMRTDVMNGGKGQVYELAIDGLRELTDKDKAERGFKALADKGENTGISEELFKSLI